MPVAKPTRIWRLLLIDREQPRRSESSGGENSRLRSDRLSAPRHEFRDVERALLMTVAAQIEFTFRENTGASLQRLISQLAISRGEDRYRMRWSRR